MKCPFCNSEVTGNFCENCGAPAPSMEEEASRDSFSQNTTGDSGGWNPFPDKSGSPGGFQQFSNAETPVKRRSAFPRILILIAVVTLVLAGFWIVSDGIKNSADSVSGTLQEDGWYSAGSYKIGKDLPAGLYYLKADEEYAHIRVKSASFFEDERFESFCCFGYLEVSDGETLEVNSAALIPAENAPLPQSEDGWYGPGMYLVGRDIPAEEYVFLRGEDGDFLSVAAYSSRGAEAELEHYFSETDRCFFTPSESFFLEVRNASFAPSAKTPPPEEQDGWYPAGTYRIGAEIPEGEYYFQTEKDSTLFINLLSDSFDDSGSTLESSYFDNFGYFTVNQGVYLNVSCGSFTKAENAPIPQPQDGIYSSGMYLCGRDIPAGPLILTPDEGNEINYEVLSDSTGNYQSVIEQGWSEEEVTIEIKDGQYLTVSYGTFRLAS